MAAGKVASVRILIEVSPGELIDRVTILELKSERLPAPMRSHARRELGELRTARDTHLKPSPKILALSEELRQTNERLWDMENDLRAFENENDFGARFIAKAREVYLQNDYRAALKRAIDLESGHTVGDLKSHPLPSVGVSTNGTPTIVSDWRGE